MEPVVYDVIVVGGGPAGSSAALVLGRCCRKVLVIDAGNPRNVHTHAVHGFLTRDGMHPSELRAFSRQQLEPYGVEIREGTVMDIEPRDGRFCVTLINESCILARKVLLATGVIDRIPQIEGIEQFYGKTVHHCPYCDAWEHRHGRIAVYGRGRGGTGLSLMMKTWTPDVVLCTDGPSRLHGEERRKLSKFGIDVYEKKIRRLEGSPPRLARIVFEDGMSIERTGMFFSTGNVQRSELVSKLGCETSSKGAVKVTRRQRTTIHGVFVAGDAAEDSQYVIIAAAHGARAAMAINADLQEEDQREA